MRGRSRSSDDSALSSATTGSSLTRSRTLGWTMATRAPSRTSRLPARQTPQAPGIPSTAPIRSARPIHRPPPRQRRTRPATSPLVAANQNPMPLAPTSSAIPTSSGKPVSEMPSPSQGNASEPGQCPRSHSLAVQAMGTATHRGARRRCTMRCSIQPKRTATPTSNASAPRNAGIASGVKPISATSIQWNSTPE